MDPQLEEPDLRSYLGTISRRRWLVVAVTLLFFGVAVAMSVLAEPQYRLKMLVQTRGPIVTEVGGVRVEADRQAEIELGSLGSTAMAGEVSRTYDGPLPLSDIQKVEANDVGSRDERLTSNLVEISLVTENPEEGRHLLLVYAETYVERAKIQDTERIQRHLASLFEDIATAEAEIQALGEPIDDPERGELQRYKRQLENQVTDLQRSIRVDTGTEARVLGLVSGGTTPVSPNIPRNLAIGLVFGLFLGVAAAFLRDYFDDSVTSKDLVERTTSVPALGLIPRFDAGESELVAAAGPNSPAAEAFRSLRTAVKFLGVDRDVRVVQVTSPSAGEGKTVTAVNLAAVLAQAGDRVVLVSADLRRPRAEEVLGVPMTPGLTGVLIGEVALPQAIRAVDGVPNLSVLAAGQLSPNPSELLSGDRARQLFDVLAQTYDAVVIDCPPVLPVTDSLILARMSDATLLVTSVRKTSRRELERAVEVLDQVETRLSGAVITSMEPEDAYAEPYGYVVTPQQRERPKPPPQRRAPDGNNVDAQQYQQSMGAAAHPQAPRSQEPWPPEFPQRN